MDYDYSMHHMHHHSCGFMIFIILIAIWSLAWKGYSLWTAAKRGERKWFVVLLLLNTLAILDIYYIFYVAKKSPAQVWKVFNRTVWTIKR